MYKQNWDRPSYLDQDGASDRSLSSGMASGLTRTTSPGSLLEFEVDYLVSFVAGPKQAAPSVDEGLSKLRQMDASSGLWTMRCTLAIHPKELVVIHRQSGDEMEKFPLALMQQIAPRESRDPKESFNNLFIFTIVEDKNPPEMHIFQALMTPASTLVDEVKKIKEGRVRSPMPPAAGNGRWPGAADDPGGFGASPRGALQAVSPPRRSMGGSDAGTSEMSELDRAEREVYLLNRCFDDIERFVGRIHLAVEAYKELQRRQNQRKKKDKKLGDGLLTMRARMPPFEEFVDCFKKFKLALNLLARLQDFIHDPNASELVHFLFTPLALVCDCSRGPPGGSPNELLGARVVSPLLSHEAVSLLRHCLTSKESELWRRLGDAWIIPRNKYSEYVPPYVPRFWDGYQPAPGDYEEAVGAAPGSADRSEVGNGAAMNAISQVVADQAQYQRKKEEAERARVEPGSRRVSESILFKQRLSRNLQAEQSVLSFPRRPNEPFGAAAVQRSASDSSGGQLPSQAPRAGMPTPPDPRVMSFQSYVSGHVDRNKRAHSDQSSPRADAVDGGLAGPPSWAQRQELFAASVLAAGGRIYHATCDKVGKNTKELTVQKGELLEVLDDSRNWWKMRNADGDVGHIPYTLLKQHQPSEADGAEQVNGEHKLPVTRRTPAGNPGDRATWAGATAPPPPPPPPPPPAPPLMDAFPSGNAARRKDEKKEEVKRRSQPEHAEELANELRMKISMGPVQPKVIKRPKSVNINQESPPGVVTDWLRLKGFTERTVSILSGKNGAGLFRMKRYEMDQQLGRDESSRLDSLLTVQKNICGYGTRSSLELRAILRKRKEHADSYIDGDGNGADQQITDEVF